MNPENPENMSLYKPAQRLDFLYIADHNALYLRATVTVPLDVNEYIPAPPPIDIIGPSKDNEILITLRVFNAVSNASRYFQTIPVLVKLENQTPSMTIDNTEEVKASLNDFIGGNLFTVTALVVKDGSEKGKVTTISSSGELEIL